MTAGPTYQDVRRKQDECPHKTKEVRRQTTRGEVVIARPQCITCGRIFNQVGGYTTKQRLALPAMLPDPAEMALAAGCERAERWARDQEKSRLDRVARYRVFLQSWEWSLMRERVLKRDRHVCQFCLVAPATEVHHYNYDLPAGEEFLTALVSTCRTCHMRWHARYRALSLPDDL